MIYPLGRAEQSLDFFKKRGSSLGREFIAHRVEYKLQDSDVLKVGAFKVPGMMAAQELKPFHREFRGFLLWSKNQVIRDRQERTLAEYHSDN